MASPNFNLKDKKSDQETLIFLRWYLSGKPFVFSTGEKIHKRFWSDKKQRVLPRHPLARTINSKLDRIEEAARVCHEQISVVDDYVRFDKLREMMRKEISGEKQTGSIFEFYPGLRNKKMTTPGYSKDSIKPYDNSIHNLKLFAKKKRLSDIVFSDFTRPFLEGFEMFLVRRGLKNNYISTLTGKTLSILRQAAKEGLIKEKAFVDFKPSVKSEQTTAIYVTSQELELMMEKEIPLERLERVRDVFVAAACTGLRHSDYAKINDDNIRSKQGYEMLYVFPKKSKEEITIPVHRITRQVLDKYGGSLPVISLQKMNDYLKEIGRLFDFLCQDVGRVGTTGGIKSSTKVKRWELLSTHTARRSFATNAYLSGWDMYLIRSITGHKNEKDLINYIRVSKEENALRIARMMEQNNLLSRLPRELG